MNHGYIDEHGVAQRFLDNTLDPAERSAFEAHLVDCQECTDRILLAGMFHQREETPEPLPLRARVAARLKPWQLVVLFAITALLLLVIPAIFIPRFVR
jgi:Putative zinc-finger